MGWSARMATIGAAGTLLFAVPGGAQLLPQLPLPVGGVVDRVTGTAGDLERTLDDASSLVRAQVARTRDLVRRHPDRIALDP